MDKPTWDTEDIRVTDEGEDALTTLDTTIFFEDVETTTEEAEDIGLELHAEGTYRLVFTDPTDTLVEGDVVIKIRKNMSGVQMNQTEYYGRENAPDWLRPHLTPVFGSTKYVVMPRCETEVPKEAFDELWDYVERRDDDIALSNEFHPQNIGLYDGVPVVFDFAVDFKLF